eukprot:8581884-Pyramimonas_sp.AAC.1
MPLYLDDGQGMSEYHLHLPADAGAALASTPHPWILGGDCQAPPSLPPRACFSTELGGRRIVPDCTG